MQLLLLKTCGFLFIRKAHLIARSQVWVLNLYVTIVGSSTFLSNLSRFPFSTMLAKSITSILFLCLGHNVKLILGDDDGGCLGGFSAKTGFTCQNAALACGIRFLNFHLSIMRPPSDDSLSILKFICTS